MHCKDISACDWPHADFAVVIPHAVLLDLDRIHKRSHRETEQLKLGHRNNEAFSAGMRANEVASYLTRLAKREIGLRRGSVQFVAAEPMSLVQSDSHNCDLHMISVARE